MARSLMEAVDEVPQLSELPAELHLYDYAN